MAYRTRAEIEAAFDVVNGTIRTPGKYEAEPVYAPYYDTLANEGDGEHRFPQCTHVDPYADGECDCVAWDYFHVDASERAEFAPYLDGVENVWLWLDSQGFLVVRTNTDEPTLRHGFHGIPTDQPL